MRAFSLDLRQRVLADYQAGMTFAELGRKYTTSAEWVRQFIRRHEKTGEIEARPTRNHRIPFHRRYEAELRVAVAENPSLTLEALRTHLAVGCDLSTIWYALRTLKISFKKKRSWPPSSNDPMWRPSASNSKRSRRSGSTPTASFSSTKPGSKPT